MCEETITSFLRQHFGFERIPVPTEAITMLIERDAADLDLRRILSDDSTRSLVSPSSSAAASRRSQSRGNCGSNGIVIIACG